PAAAGAASRAGRAGVVVLGRRPDVRPDGAAARGPAPGAAVGRRRAPDEARVATPTAPAPGRRRNLRLRIRPPVGARLAREANAPSRAGRRGMALPKPGHGVNPSMGPRPRPPCLRRSRLGLGPSTTPTHTT